MSSRPPSPSPRPPHQLCPPAVCAALSDNEPWRVSSTSEWLPSGTGTRGSWQICVGSRNAALKPCTHNLLKKHPMGRKCFLPLQPSSVAMPSGHNGAFKRGSWKGVLAGRLEVEHCSWGGGGNQFISRSEPGCQFPKQNCCFSELVVVGKETCRDLGIKMETLLPRPCCRQTEAAVKNSRFVPAGKMLEKVLSASYRSPAVDGPNSTRGQAKTKELYF